MIFHKTRCVHSSHICYSCLLLTEIILVLVPFTIRNSIHTFPYSSGPNAKVPILTVAIPVPPISNDIVTTPVSDSDDESDKEESSGQSPKRREAERLRVLEAAGLIVLGSSAGRSPAGVKRRATRRVAPARPPRQALPALPTMVGSPPAPLEDEEAQVKEDQHEERMEDAYDVNFLIRALLHVFDR